MRNINKNNIDVNNINYSPVATLKQGDNATLELALFKGGQEFDITGQTVTLGAHRPNNTVVEQIDGFTINRNVLTIKLKNSILAIHGIVEIELNLEDSEGEMTTSNFFIKVNKKILGEDNLAASDEFNSLKQLKIDLQNAKENEDIRIKNEKDRVAAEITREERNKEISLKCTKMEDDYNKAIANVTNGNESATNSEIVQARGKSVNLGARLDGIDSQLSEKVKPFYLKNICEKKDVYFGMKDINIIGDSISQGFNATNRAELSWSSIIRKLMNFEFGVNNLGFVSFIMSNNDYHDISRVGTWQDSSNGNNLGLYSWISVDSNGILKANLKIKQKYASFCYKVNSNGGIIDVYTNGSKRFSFDTSKGTGKTDSINLENQTFPCLIEFRKVDNKPTELSGAWYSNEDQSSTVMFNNYARTGTKLIDVSEEILSKMMDANIVFFALGHNDSYAGVDIELFRKKIDKVIELANTRKCFFIVLDFMWKFDKENIYKKELIRLYNSVQDTIFISPNDYLYGNNVQLMIENGLLTREDTSHPTDKFHKIIGESTAKILGLSISSNNSIQLLKTSQNISDSDSDWKLVGDAVQFLNNFKNTFDNLKYKTKYRKINNTVQIEIYVTGGEKNKAIFQLPVGFRPNFTTSVITKIETHKSGLLFMGFVISEDGTVTVNSNYDYTNFNGMIIFPIK